MGPPGFFGEECLLAPESLRLNTVATLVPSTVFQIDKDAMQRAIYSQPAVAASFMASLLRRKVDLEEDLCDHLFNDTEKRLARALLKLARTPPSPVPRLSHQTLAEMVGSTRSRITYFMNKFRRMGLIDYNGHARDSSFELIVKTARLVDAVLQE
jgi:CRP/FNR family cyclic AMP-dependent transcriptional regulator